MPPSPKELMCSVGMWVLFPRSCLVKHRPHKGPGLYPMVSWAQQLAQTHRFWPLHPVEHMEGQPWPRRRWG